MKIFHFIKSIFPESFLYHYYSISRMSYSQIGQDIWVYKDVFKEKRNGFFVEIGSADGITLSNTFLLESKFNWKGVCIEANPHYFTLLNKFRKVECVNACIDEVNGEVVFHSNGLESGIIFNESAESFKNTDNTNIFKIQSYSLSSVFEKYNLPSIVDYLSIDIEGAEWIALKNFPFEKYRFNCITIERPNKDVRELLHKNGYIIVKEFEELDVYYIHVDFMDTYKKNQQN